MTAALEVWLRTGANTDPARPLSAGIVDYIAREVVQRWQFESGRVVVACLPFIKQAARG